MLKNKYDDLRELILDFIKVFDGKTFVMDNDSFVKGVKLSELLNDVQVKVCEFNGPELNYDILKLQFDLLTKNYDTLNKKYEELKKDSSEFEKYWNGYRRQMLKELKSCGACCKNCYWFSKYSNTGVGCISDYYCSATKFDWEIPNNAIDKCICHRYMSDKSNNMLKLDAYKVVNDEKKNR